jgi:hypothetical protein
MPWLREKWKITGAIGISRDTRWRPTKSAAKDDGRESRLQRAEVRPGIADGAHSDSQRKVVREQALQYFLCSFQVPSALFTRTFYS